MPPFCKHMKSWIWKMIINGCYITKRQPVNMCRVMGAQDNAYNVDLQINKSKSDQVSRSCCHFIGNIGDKEPGSWHHRDAVWSKNYPVSSTNEWQGDNKRTGGSVSWKDWEIPATCHVWMSFRFHWGKNMETTVKFEHWLQNLITADTPPPANVCFLFVTLGSLTFAGAGFAFKMLLSRDATKMAV